MRSRIALSLCIAAVCTMWRSAIPLQIQQRRMRKIRPLPLRRRLWPPTPRQARSEQTKEIRNETMHCMCSANPTVTRKRSSRAVTVPLTIFCLKLSSEDCGDTGTRSPCSEPSLGKLWKAPSTITSSTVQASLPPHHYQAKSSIAYMHYRNSKNCDRNISR